MNTTEDPQNQFHGLLFDVRRSVRYHNRRVRFFDTIHHMATLFALLFGSATIAAFGGVIANDWPLWAKLLPAFIASVFAAVDLVFGTVQKARQHAILARDFIELESRMESGRNKPTASLMTESTRRRLEIEAGEPPVLRVLDVLCRNELLRAMGYDQTEQTEVGFFPRLFAHLFDLRIPTQTETDH